MRETDPARLGSVALAHEILAYMVEHPKAQDTFEGIVQWWLLERQIRNWTVKIRAALAGLVEEGLVLERAGRDGHARYSINRGKLPQIRARLHDASEPNQLQGSISNPVAGLKITGSKHPVTRFKRCPGGGDE